MQTYGNKRNENKEKTEWDWNEWQQISKKRESKSNQNENKSNRRDNTNMRWKKNGDRCRQNTSNSFMAFTSETRTTRSTRENIHSHVLRPLISFSLTSKILLTPNGNDLDKRKPSTKKKCWRDKFIVERSNKKSQRFFHVKTDFGTVCWVVFEFPMGKFVVCTLDLLGHFYWVIQLNWLCFNNFIHLFFILLPMLSVHCSSFYLSSLSRFYS